MKKKIEKLEKSQKEIDLELSDPEKFKELSKEEGFFNKYKENQQRLKELENAWGKAVEQLEIKK